MVRLQKILSAAGIASRRAGEKLILEGRVSVNGRPVSELGAKADPAHDRVTVDGRPVSARRQIYVALNKPAGVLCTRRDEPGRAVPPDRLVVGDLLPAEWAHLFPVGRLDRDTEGLLLLTNDGEFSLRLTHPRYQVAKVYEATVSGPLPPAVLTQLTTGILDQGENLKADRAELVVGNNTRSTVRLTLTEGKNREIRRMFESLGREVEQLRRLQIGPLRLGELRVGKWRVLTAAEVGALLKPASARSAPARPATAGPRQKRPPNRRSPVGTKGRPARQSRSFRTD